MMHGKYSMNVAAGVFSSGYLGANAILLFFLGWMAVINLLGFFMILDDCKRMKEHRMRLSPRQFTLNVLLGGAPGQVLGMVVLRHTPDAAMTLLVMLLLMTLQIWSVVYFTSSEGQRKLREWSPARAREDWNETVRDAKSFLHTIDSDTREDMARPGTNGE